MSIILQWGHQAFFAIETKMRTKRLTDKKCEVIYTGAALFFNDKPQQPQSGALEQASNQSESVRKWLSKATGKQVSVQPVLSLPGWWVNDADSKKGKVWVFNHKKMYRLAEPSSTRLSKSDIEAISYQVSQHCIRDDIKPKVFERGENSLFNTA